MKWIEWKATFLTGLKKFGNKIISSRETIGYYAVLAIVLVALSAAAYDYRSERSERIAQQSTSVPEIGVAVQTHPDPTLDPMLAEKKFILPVQGKLLTDFSDNELSWSTTLQLWQTHPAVDIAASAGEAVLAAADGEVIEAYSDALYGNMITIDHGEGRLLRYASLNTLKMVQVGQRVQQGEVISAVGTCNAEAEDGAHVHIEYLEDKIKKDFLLLIDQSDLDNLRE